jgi:hypothetical protein
MEVKATLAPRRPGIKKLLKEQNSQLLYVRYCYGVARPKRLKTEEIIVDELEWNPEKEALMPFCQRA